MNKNKKDMLVSEIDDLEMRFIRIKDSIIDLLDELEIIRNKIERMN